MCDHIKELYYREQDQNRLIFRESDEYDIIGSKLDRYHDKIGDALGTPDFNEYWDLYIQHTQMEHIACFRHGFRLAVHLLLT